MTASSPIKKMILYLGQPTVDLEEVRGNLVEALGSRANPIFVLAKDGPDAERKVSNQKFDALIIDHKAPRLYEGVFLPKMKSSKNTANSHLLVLVPQEDWLLPPTLAAADQTLVLPCSTDLLVRALAKALATPDLQVVQETADKGGTDGKGAFAVDVRVLNAIVKSACFVCQQFGIETQKFQKPQVRKDGASWSGDIASSIEIQSRLFKGLLVLSFDQNVYLSMLGNMLGEEYTCINAENSDAIGELSNMILGNAKADFTQYDVGMSIPKILQRGSAIEGPPGKASILLTGETAKGLIYIEVVAYPTKAAA